MSDTEPSAPSGATRAECLCCGLGPQLTALVRSMGPPEEVVTHLRGAQLELLQAVRAFVDHRIQTLSRQDRRGTKISIE